ncbi:TetR/AcrR family transcriptional regulator [Bifidobacterium amazonense]|uniref:TetR/AcrR family transcriptional regulator n=1 Tax=Bifidobacterium amazonense TaxID=2809027 RepID=A0ABS9VVF7_9BIFI|nr:TetR/AcrR family transcriptional regulator [Bifidobacterium amazonense]MCH9276085.1 TetR/AcrR family transcriptional regulator [Bifidobacterium amazonense]
MTRPRAGERSAPEKMQEAFWLLLEQKPYAQITISDITRVSGLNRSAFYYHYGNIPELADDAIAAIYEEPDIIAFITSIVRQRDATGGIGTIDDIRAFALANVASPQRMANVRRLSLIAGPHGSAGLAAQLKTRVIDIWMAALGRDSATLNPGQHILLEFVSSGVLGILAKAPALFTAENVEWLSGSILPNVISQLINSLRDGGDSDEPSPGNTAPHQAGTASV